MWARHDNHKRRRLLLAQSKHLTVYGMGTDGSFNVPVRVIEVYHGFKMATILAHDEEIVMVATKYLQIPGDKK